MGPPHCSLPGFRPPPRFTRSARRRVVLGRRFFTSRSPPPSVLVRLDSLCPSDPATIIAKDYAWQNHPPPPIRPRPAQSAPRRRPTQPPHPSMSGPSITQYHPVSPSITQYHPVSPKNLPERLLRPNGSISGRFGRGLVIGLHGRREMPPREREFPGGGGRPGDDCKN
jgi:hypothetical protein